MSVRTLLACVPKSFTCKFVIPSGPVEDVFLSHRWPHYSFVL